MLFNHQINANTLFFTAVSFSLCVELTQFFGLFMGCQCINDLVQISVHDLIQIVDLSLIHI